MFSRLTLLLLAATWCSLGESTSNPDTRIVGGKDATENSRPFQISLRKVDVVRDTKDHICSGSIVSTKYVLTAAHCVYQITVGRLLVIAGGNKLDGDGDWHYVDSVKIHEDYKNGFDNDIALMKMKVPFEFKKNIASIKLASGSGSSNMVCEVSGWGLTKDFKNTKKLQVAKVTTTTFGDCYYVYQKFEGFKITKYHICTYKKDGGICYGDGGDPLTYRNELVGVASYVVPCAKNYPDIFVNVYSYKNWIEKNMN